MPERTPAAIRVAARWALTVMPTGRGDALALPQLTCTVVLDVLRVCVSTAAGTGAVATAACRNQRGGNE